MLQLNKKSKKYICEHSSTRLTNENTLKNM